MSAPTPAGGRFVAWAGFAFGSIMSVAANVLHTWLPAAHMPAGWSPGIAPQIGAAVWPIGLLISVEVLSRVQWPDTAMWRLAKYGGAGTVAVGSAIISYGHLHDVLIAWHYTWIGAVVGPLVLDGLMVVSGFALLAMGKPPAVEAKPTPKRVNGQVAEQVVEAKPAAKPAAKPKRAPAPSSPQSVSLDKTPTPQKPASKPDADQHEQTGSKRAEGLAWARDNWPVSGGAIAMRIGVSRSEGDRIRSKIKLEMEKSA